MSGSNCCLLICVQISQEAGKVVWYYHLFKDFPQFVIIHTVKGFGIVNKAEVDVFLGEGNGIPLQYSCLENPMDGGAWWAAVHSIAKSQTRLSDFPFTFHFHALEKEMATHSRVLAWRIPGTGEPGGLPSMGLHRVGHDWSDLVTADVFLELSCIFDDPVAVVNLISDSSAFSKSSLNIWKFTIHILLKPGLENFEHYFASVWGECNCAVVWAFFGIAFFGIGMKTDLF